MPKTSDITPGDRLKMLFTGFPGTRKTTSIGSFPGSIYICDFDHRLAPIKRFYPDRTDIEYDSFDGQKKNFNAFREKFEEFQDYCPYDLVVVDSLTFFADAILDYVLGFKGSGKGKKKGVISLYDLEEFGGEAKGLTDMLNIARVIPAHFILTAHITLVSDATRSYKALITGGKKVSFKIPGWFDEVYHFETESPLDGSETKYFVYTVPNGNDYGCKTNLPLPNKIDITDEPLFDAMARILEPKGIKIGGDKKLTQSSVEL